MVFEIIFQGYFGRIITIEKTPHSFTAFLFDLSHDYSTSFQDGASFVTVLGAYQLYLWTHPFSEYQLIARYSEANIPRTID